MLGAYSAAKFFMLQLVAMLYGQKMHSNVTVSRTRDVALSN